MAFHDRQMPEDMEAARFYSLAIFLDDTEIFYGENTAPNKEIFDMTFIKRGFENRWRRSDGHILKYNTNVLIYDRVAILREMKINKMKEALKSNETRIINVICLYATREMKHESLNERWRVARDLMKSRPALHDATCARISSALKAGDIDYLIIGPKNKYL